MAEKVGKALKGKGGNTAQTAAPSNTVETSSQAAGESYESETDVIVGFVDQLEAPRESSFRSVQVNDLDIKENETLTYKSLAEAVKNCPALPTTAQIIAQEVAPIQAFSDFNYGTMNLFQKVGDSTNETIMEKAAAVDKKNRALTGNDAQRQMMDNNAMQIFQLFQKYGIDPEKMDEKAMEKFVMEKIASGELKIPTSGGIINTDFDEKQEATIDAVGEILDELFGKVESEMDYGDTSRELRKLYEDQRGAWKGSEAYNKVLAIEQDIDKRVKDYLPNHPDYGNNGAEIVYPDFWVEGRKKENAIINEFNTKNVDQWRDALQGKYDHCVAIFKELAEADEKVEASFPDKKDYFYAIYKNKVNNMVALVSRTMDLLYSNIYGAPVVSSVEESNRIVM